MKIIDILNKIANGEEPPKKIKVFDEEFKYSIKDFDYFDEDFLWLFQDYEWSKELNTEVEILETTITYNQDEKITLEDFKNLGYSLSKIKDKIQEGWEEAEKEDKIEKIEPFEEEVNISKFALEYPEVAKVLKSYEKRIAKLIKVVNKINEIIDCINKGGN